MRFSIAYAPYIAPATSVGSVMRCVLLAMIPGIAVQIWQFGFGVPIQLTVAVAATVTAEGVALKLRGRSAAAALRDGSAVLTAALLAVSLPPLLPWWQTVFGAWFAIWIGKQVYGGLGYNPFNPAMLGYAALLISFPKTMTHWLPPADLTFVHLSFAETASAVFTRSLPPGLEWDAVAQATPLDAIRTGLRLHRSLNDIRIEANLGSPVPQGWSWVNLAYLVGGLWLWRRRLIARQIPIAFLGILSLASLILVAADPAAHAGPLFHLFSGGTMLGAFFIATDPVTAATTARGRWIYGGLIGFLVWVIRTFGGYPDGIAFAVLLMNLTAPTIDHWCRPRPGETGR